MKMDRIELFEVEPMASKLVVYCSDDFNNIHGHLKKKKNEHIVKFFKHHKNYPREAYNEAVLGFVGFSHREGYEDRPIMIYVNTKCKRSEIDLTIIHETNHLVEYFALYFGFGEEREFKAYLQEHLCRIIRKVIK